MNKEENKIFPQLRFPEFVDDGNWVEEKIKSVCEKPFSGGTPTSTKVDYYGGKIPFIRSAEINKEKTELFLTQLGLENSSAKMVNKGDVLLAMYGANSGDVGISKINGAINQAIICLRSKTNNTFLFHYLEHKKNGIIQKYLQGGQGNLSGDIIKSIELFFPKNPKEQQKITNCLSSLDDVINTETEKLDLLQDHKKGLLQQLFQQQDNVTLSGVEGQPKYRFPEFVDDGGWEEMTLNDVCDVTNGKSNAQDHVENGKYPLFDRSEVIKASDKFLFDCETVILPGEGMRFIPKYYKGKFDLHQRAYALKNFKYVGNYIYYYMLANSALLASKAVRSTVLSLRLPIIQKFPILLPVGEKGILEQQKIAKCLSSVDELIESQQQKIEGLKAHKKGLLQKLFPTIKN